MADKQDKREEEKPKIIVDDDWKAQALAEKEKLAKDIEAGDAAPKAGAQADSSEPHELPPANFATLVGSLVTQIFFALGGMEDPQSKKRYVDPALAKHHIDMLSVLEEKTAGNLTAEEKKILDKALYETRMRYVELAQHI